MKAGKLDRLVTLKHRTLTRNSYGEQVESFTEYASVWAQKLDVLGREYFAAQTVVGEGTAKFRLRYRDDIVLTDLIVYGDNEYNIKQVSEIGRREGLEIIARVRPQ